MKNKTLTIPIVTLIFFNLILFLLIQVPAFAISCKHSGNCVESYCYSEAFWECEYQCWQYSSECSDCDAQWERCGTGDCECWSNWDCTCENQESFWVLCHEFSWDCVYEPVK